MIADPNPVFRAVVLDAEHGEVFMANDKESAGTSVLVYPTQFPSTNRIMEPKRRIAGPKTDLGMVCGLALSIEHGELYSVSGETGTLNVYPLDSTGNVGPARRLRGVMPRASAGVFLDVKNDELFITTEHVNRISVYPRTFQEDQEPLRFIQGPATGLGDPHGIYVDSTTNEIFVGNHVNWRETQPGEVAAGVEARVDLAPAAELLDVAGQRRLQSEVVERGRAKLTGEHEELLHRLVGERLRLRQLDRQLGRRLLADRLQAQKEAGQCLIHLVVEVASDPRPLPLLGGQCGARATRLRYEC